MDNQEKMIIQEQEKLDKLIANMDRVLLKIHKDMSEFDLKIKKAKASCLPEAYGDLVSSQNGKMEKLERSKHLRLSRDELYKTRIEVVCSDENGTELEDIKIGLHSFIYGKDVFIMSWKMPLSRHYIMDNAAVDFDNVVWTKDGEKYHTHYELRRKRNVTLDFDRVKEVISYFPANDEEDEQIIADEFLKELLKRRSEREFKNIVFSIQRQQGEIIQTDYMQNMIVQGCAGSGKSMIMLHRLPIVLYDNPKSLDRANLYIITPSLAYIQMANNMMVDLEIDDLNMGTLNQYYDHVISLYGVSSKSYGKLREHVRLSSEVIHYVYSTEFIDRVRREMQSKIGVHITDYSKWHQLLKLEDTKKKKRSDAKTPYETIQEVILGGQLIQRKMYERQREYHKLLRDVVDHFHILEDLLLGRKIAVINGINRKKERKQKELEKVYESLRQLDPEKNLRTYEKIRDNTIESISLQLEMLVDAYEIASMDDEYFGKLSGFANYEIKGLFRRLNGYSKDFEKIKTKELFDLYDLRQYICDFYDAAQVTLTNYGDLYAEYPENPEGIEECLGNMKTSVDNLRKYNMPWLSYDDSELLRESISYYERLLNGMAKDVYLSQMQLLGTETDSKGDMYALPCSPFMYLQILYLFKGCHNQPKENLITIDEAQNIMPEELKLIRAVNNNKVVLNLFGDVRQHFEGTKGIDDWQRFESVVRFKKFDMRENYRNARQITNFCNRRFGLKMRAVNLDGKGVHVISNQEEFLRVLKKLFMKPQSPGLSCILVKNREEAESILTLIPEYGHRIQKLAIEPIELHPNKWNLVTVDQVKGLEFETVIAISGRMSRNERYVSYTRALDELYVYENEIPLVRKDHLEILASSKQQPDTVETPSNIRRKRVKRTISDTVKIELQKSVHNPDMALKNDNIDIKEYCDLSGFEVIDMRRKKGILWVIGERDELEPFIDKLTQKYGISGKFMKDKETGFRMGWCVKL